MNYGIWPFDQVTSWLSDEGESLLAEIGYSAGPDVYDSLAPRMTQGPVSDQEAYEQAIYFLGIGARRADFEDEKAAQSFLVSAKRQLESAKSDLETNYLCTLLGVNCISLEAVQTLQQAIEAVNNSGINEEDRKTLVSYLKGNKRALQLRLFAPWMGGVALVGLGYWYWTRQ